MIESAAQSGDVPADIPASPVVEPAVSSDGAPAFYRPERFSVAAAFEAHVAGLYGIERLTPEQWADACFRSERQ